MTTSWHSEVSPPDEHNTTLLERVRPSDWKNPSPAPLYDLVVVGAGTGGLICAAVGAGLGARVALVERNLMGGDCLNYGCVPSKAVIRHARRVAEAREVLGDAGLDDALLDREFSRAMERMRAIRADISRDDSATRYRDELGVDVFQGNAQFTGKDTVTVAGATLRFRKAVIASGARADVPAIPGLAEAGFVTNETVFNLTERPRRVAVIGGGPIGCELAQAMRRLGCEVTLLHMEGHLLHREDADAAAVVQQRFVSEGVRLVLGAEVLSVSASGGSKRRPPATSSSSPPEGDRTWKEWAWRPPASPSTPGASAWTTTCAPRTRACSPWATVACDGSSRTPRMRPPRSPSRTRSSSGARR